jgi:hypothetical protein
VLRPHELLGSLAGANRMSGRHRHLMNRVGDPHRPAIAHMNGLSPGLRRFPLFESRFDGEKIFVFAVLRVFGILMGVRLIPGRRQSKIVAFGRILALVHRPPWPFTPVGQAPPLLTNETAPESGVKGRLISERYEPMPT